MPLDKDMGKGADIDDGPSEEKPPDKRADANRSSVRFAYVNRSQNRNRRLVQSALTVQYPCSCLYRNHISAATRLGISPPQKR